MSVTIARTYFSGKGLYVFGGTFSGSYTTAKGRCVRVVKGLRGLYYTLSYYILGGYCTIAKGSYLFGYIARGLYSYRV